MRRRNQLPKSNWNKPNLDEQRINYMKEQHKHIKLKPFRMLICAQSGGGKTYLVKDIITDIVKHKKIRPKCIYWVSTTCDLDPQQMQLINDLGIQKVCPDKFPGGVEQILKLLIIKIQDNIDNKIELHPRLLIFDDMISEDLMYANSKKSQILKSLLTSGRHRLISTMILIQNLKACPNTCRLQMSHILIGMTPDRDKLNEWLKQYRGKLPFQDMIDRYEAARSTNNGYGFLAIHTQERDDSDKRLQDNITYDSIW